MSTELTTYQPTESAVVASMDFMPVFDMAKAIQRRNMLVQFTQTIMHDGLDYGTIPGSSKPCLLKAGAEKLCTFFGLVPEFVITEQVEDWTGVAHDGEAFFYYRYKCRLSRNGRLIGEGEGSCNTWESKYRYRWVSEAWAKSAGFDISHLVKRGGAISEFAFAIDKAETNGKYGKPPEYWAAFREAIENGTARQVKRKKKDGGESPAWEIDAVECRIPNPDVADQVNTCQKMSQKRALVAAVLIAVNASEYFTQDLDDLEQIDSPVLHHAPVTDAVQKSNGGDEQSSHLPDELREMHRIMATEKANGFKKVFGQLQERIGYEEYVRILKQHDVDSWQDFKSLKKAQQCVQDLFNRVLEAHTDADKADLFAQE